MQQLELFVERRGGKRKGAGRKSPTGEPKLRHEKRAKFTAAQPLFLTVKLLRGLRSLRGIEEKRIVKAVLGIPRSLRSRTITCTSSSRPRIATRSRAACRASSCG